jgi:hypothetical protein
MVMVASAHRLRENVTKLETDVNQKTMFIEKDCIGCLKMTQGRMTTALRKKRGVKMGAVSKVFQQTYESYLAQIGACDLKSLAEPLGVNYQNGALEIPLLDRSYTVSGRSISDQGGEKPAFNICVILSKYVLLCPKGEVEAGDWVSFRDFKDTAPLAAYFANDVEGTFAGRFNGNLKTLRHAGDGLGGREPKIDLAYDYARVFTFLPRLAMLLLFNDGDEEFRAQGTVLFQKRADQYLDGECLAMAASYLVRRIFELA